MSKHQSKLIIRITILGDKGTGKTTFMKSYIDEIGEMNMTLSPVVSTAHTFNTVVDDMNVRQEILDSDGKNIAVTAWAHGAVVMYSTDNYNSFLVAEECISSIKEVTMRDALILLVGNHIDVQERIITTEDGEKLSARYKCCFIELSAQTDQSDVSNVVYELSQQILLRRGLRHTSAFRKSPQIFRRMMDAVTRRNSGGGRLSIVKEFREQINPVKETNI